MSGDPLRLKTWIILGAAVDSVHDGAITKKVESRK